MELVHNNWNDSNILEFQKYLESIKNEEKIEWTKNLLKTSMPVLAIKTPDLKRIANEIYKGSYLSFLDYMKWDYYENTAINGILISKIKDFKTYKKYLKIYSKKCDNWASCDLLTFNIIGKEKEYFDLSKELIQSKLPFVRRIGIDILFKYIEKSDYISFIFDIINSFYEEKEYYVNMVLAWLLCECMTKQKDKTLEMLKTHKLNNFVVNKFIQKCRDSYRISDSDKEYLLKYKVKG